MFACKGRRDSITIPPRECQDAHWGKDQIPVRENEAFFECAQTLFCFAMGRSVIHRDTNVLRSPAAEGRAELFEQWYYVNRIFYREREKVFPGRRIGASADSNVGEYGDRCRSHR